MLTTTMSGFPDPAIAVQACDRFADALDEEGLEALAHHLDVCSQAQVLCSWRLFLTIHEAACPFHAYVVSGLGEKLLDSCMTASNQNILR